jgi:hypothetical protein
VALYAVNVLRVPSALQTVVAKSVPNDRNLVRTDRRAFAKSDLCRRDLMLKSWMKSIF